jgi:nucleotide-binding universal stress UspA family protein
MRVQCPLVNVRLGVYEIPWIEKRPEPVNPRAKEFDSMDVKTILWPTDLHRSMGKAAKHVADLAEKHDARVVVLYVGVDLCEYFPAYGNYPSKEELSNFQSWELEHAKKDLEAVCDKELKSCPNWEVKLVQGDATSKILEHIQAQKADLVVVAGSAYVSEKSLGGGATVGSVAKNIVEQSPVPVQIIKP